MSSTTGIPGNASAIAETGGALEVADAIALAGAEVDTDPDADPEAEADVAGGALGDPTCALAEDVDG